MQTGGRREMEVDKDRLKIKGTATVVLDKCIDAGYRKQCADPRDIQETRGLEQRAYV